MVRRGWWEELRARPKAVPEWGFTRLFHTALHYLKNATAIFMFFLYNIDHI